MSSSRLRTSSSGRRAGATLVLTALLHGCFDARPRPTPVEAEPTVSLSAQVLAPRAGQAVAAGTDVVVRVMGRDFLGTGLHGVGFVAKQFTPLRPVVDSVAVRFTARADSTHEFLLRIPATLPSNTQIDIWGLAYGPGTQTFISPSSYVIAVRCVNGVCQ